MPRRARSPPGSPTRLDCGDAEWRRAWLDAGRLAAEAIEAEMATAEGPTEPGRPCGAARLYRGRDARLYGILDADSRPGGVRALGRCVGDLPLQPGRERNRRPDLVRHRRRGRDWPGPPGSITGDLGLYHDMNGLAALRRVERAGADRGAQQRRRRDLRVPAPGRSDRTRRVRGAARDAAGASTRRGSPASTACLTHASPTSTGSKRPPSGPA